MVKGILRCAHKNIMNISRKPHVRCLSLSALVNTTNCHGALDGMRISVLKLFRIPRKLYKF